MSTLLRQALVPLYLAAFSGLGAQQSWRITVRDSAGFAVPYAIVEAIPGGRRVADIEGVATFSRQSSETVLLQVRRIGYAMASVRVPPSVDADVRLMPLARTLETVNVTDRQNTLLAQRGFYERMERVQRGAIVGEFITPEDLEEIGPMTPSRALSRSRFVRVVREGGRGVSETVFVGRGDCAFTVLVDGQRVESVQDRRPGLTSIDQNGTVPRDPPGVRPPSIEEILPGSDIAAIEVYPSAANAPSELQARAMAGRGSCGIIAIWTGGRR